MRSAIAITILLLAVGNSAAMAAPGDTLWTKTYGGGLNDRLHAAKSTADGGYILCGWTYSFAGGSGAVYLVKTDSSGNTIWTKAYGGGQYKKGLAVQQTTDGGYIVVGSVMAGGAGSQDIYLLKTDSYGNLSWAETLGGGANDEGWGVQQTPDGGYIIGGYTYSYGRSSDVYVVKTNQNGNLVWKKTYGGGGEDKGFAIEPTNDNGYIIVGYTNSFREGGGDVYLVKIDASGDTIWTRTFGGDNFDQAGAVQQTVDGGFIILGETSSFGLVSPHIYLIKTDPFGNQEWGSFIGESKDASAHGVQQTSDGGYIIAGTTTPHGANKDIYLIKVDSSGNDVWERMFGGRYLDEGWVVLKAADGGYMIAGTTTSFGMGSDDFYLVRMVRETK